MLMALKRTLTVWSNNLRHNKTHFVNRRRYSPSQRSTNSAISTPYYFSKMRSVNVEPWSKKNRNGLIQFGVSENFLSNDLLIDKLNSLQKQIEITSQTILYSSCKYYEPLQESTSNFIHKNIAKQYKLHPEHLIITSGVGSLFAPLLFSLCDIDDIIILPSPFFSGFQIDMKLMTSINLIGINTDPINDYNITIETLNNIYTKYGNKIKGLVLTSPNNPLGKIYDKQQIQMVFKWCVDHNIHFIADELFALCQINKNKQFISSIDCLYDCDGFDKYFHFVYGLSKDLCLSGIRMGYYYTENQNISNMMKQYHYNYNIPILIQQLVNEMLMDQKWCDMFLMENQQRIQKRFHVLRECLKHNDITYYEPDYGLSVWLNFGQYLQRFMEAIRNDRDFKNQTEMEILFEMEKALYFTFLNEQNLSLAPGQCFESTIPGYFRLCFTVEQDDDIIFDAVTRMTSVMKQCNLIDNIKQNRNK